MSSSQRQPSTYGGGTGDRKPLTPTELIGKRVDLPADAYLTATNKHRFTPRPGFNTQGKPIHVDLNVFPVTEFRDQDIYQYDIAVTPTNEINARTIIRKVWNSQVLQEYRSQHGGTWLFDNHKNAWSSKPIPKNELRRQIDLDKEQPDQPARKGGNNMFHVKIAQSTTVKLSYLYSYLNGNVGWDNSVLEGMNFFDHAMRQSASNNMLQIRRNFYPTGVNAHAVLDNMLIEVRKGYYAAARLSESKKLMINVDTANTAFWHSGNLAEVAMRMCNAHKREWKSWDIPRMADFLMPVQMTDEKGRKYWGQSDAFRVLKKMWKLKFIVFHRGKMNTTKVYTIKSIMFDPKYGKEGAHSRNVTFMKKSKDGKPPVETTIWQHYRDQYNARLQYPTLPIIESTRGGLFPMEVCDVAPYQRYPFKLDPNQTSEMIKIAVTRPVERRRAIVDGFEKLKFPKDPILAEFGIRVAPTMVTTKARLLQNPEVTFGANSKINPGVTGRWDLRGKQFLEPNQRELLSWGFVVCGNACTKAEAEAFSLRFTQAYRGHGGKIKEQPMILQYAFSFGDYGDIVKDAWTKVAYNFKCHPRMMFFIVQDKNSLVYERIKKSMDCRFCAVSQVMIGGQVKKCNAQYISNVAMKVNAKLGGVTCKVGGPGPAPPFFQVPTMILGADVTHGSPGTGAPSIAAITMSMDRFATRYAAAVEANGYAGDEILDQKRSMDMFKPLLISWHNAHKMPPKHVYYFRDGIDEGQFQRVIDSELEYFREVFQTLNFAVPKFTVVIATKRHHIRFFPKPNDKSAADRNGNPLPGTLVERDATHPHHFDFYLCSHVAIQGTARPVHYQVIHDDAGVSPDQLQKMIYHQCYQYARSTTPVSLHPAVYYAHLAAARGKSHENIHASRKEYAPAPGKEGMPTAKRDSDIKREQKPMPPPLLPMAVADKDQPTENVRFMNLTMWYI